MNIALHELIHLLLSLLPATIIIIAFKNMFKKHNYLITLLLITSLIGGFFIDLDHLIDYVLAFGFHFKLDYFIKGYQFLKSDKIYVLLHSYELVVFLLLISIIFMSFRALARNLSNKKLMFISLLTFTLGLSMLLHVIFDVIENELPPQTYSLIYRIKNNFDTKNLVYPDHYRYHLEQKKKILLP